MSENAREPPHALRRSAQTLGVAGGGPGAAAARRRRAPPRWAARLCAWAFGLGLACAPKGQPERPWTVATTYLPARIEPRENMINVFHYINLQLFSPLFLRDAATGGLDSIFLDMAMSGATRAALDSYRMCLRAGVTFSDGTAIDPEDLASSLQAAHRTHPLLEDDVAIWVEGRCARVRLTAPDPAYLDRLTTVASTVLARDTESSPVPLGLGAYRVAARTPSAIRLEATGHVPTARFSEVVIEKVASLSEAIDRGFDDVNLLYWDAFRSERLTGRARLSHPIMRTHMVVVSHPDAARRRCFCGTVDLAGLADILRPLELTALPGYLPTGTLGFDVDFQDLRGGLAGDCEGLTGEKPRITYLNHLAHLQGALETFFARQAAHLPFTIEVRPGSLEDVIAAFLSHRDLLYLVGADSPTSQLAQLGEPAQFLERFYTPRRFVSLPLTQLEPIVRAAMTTFDPDTKKALYLRAHRCLLESGHLVPLGQIAPYLYYPRDLASFRFADATIGYPQIWSLR